MNNINALDRILIRSKDEVEKLLAWRDANKDLVRKYSPVLKKGIIQSFNGISYVFEQQGDFIKYKVFVNNEHFMKIFIIKLSNGMYKILNVICDKYLSEQIINENVQSVATMHFTVMAYMENYKEYVTSKRVKQNQPSINKKQNKSKNNNNNARRMGKVVYEITVPSNLPKRSRKSPEGVFPVCGHSRKYKSGKVIWIESYVKGDKTKQVSPKTYHL